MKEVDGRRMLRIVPQIAACMTIMLYTGLLSAMCMLCITYAPAITHDKSLMRALGVFVSDGIHAWCAVVFLCSHIKEVYIFYGLPKSWASHS